MSKSAMNKRLKSFYIGGLMWARLRLIKAEKNVEEVKKKYPDTRGQDHLYDYETDVRNAQHRVEAKRNAIRAHRNYKDCESNALEHIYYWRQ